MKVIPSNHVKTEQTLDSKSLSHVAIKGLKEIKGKEIVLMRLAGLDAAVTDYFVICTGTSDKHVQALANSVIDFIRKEAGEKPISKEGFQAGDWILLDYANVVIHIFLQDKREFYRIEDLWGDAPAENIE